jgi:hypothetical protein
MNKIKISTISRDVFYQKGFDDRGCYGCACQDTCCTHGCDVDRESYHLIFEYRELIEELVGVKLEDCFEENWSGDKEYLGGNSIRSKRGQSNFCIFNVHAGKGCILYHLVSEVKVPRRIIPSICRLYPLTWDNGGIGLEKDCEPTCNCLEKENHSQSNIFETQKHEIKDIFEIRGEMRRGSSSTDED